jgi:hypothetical protein
MAFAAGRVLIADQVMQLDESFRTSSRQSDLEGDLFTNDSFCLFVRAQP